ncbi:MAG: V-type ATPase subunit [Candidatus Omnitrophica bacterium]|jgi:V/A-type H+-transporting ATPase subunit C|nr:V-type ATPase subunit [Candidatus Omnitrophota bacterium]
MLDLTKYSFANAKIRAMLSYLIDADYFKRLVEAQDFYELLDFLKKTSYKDIAEKINREEVNLERLEKELVLNDLHIYKKVYGMLPTNTEKNFVALLTQRFEIDELKTVLRIWHKKMEVELSDYILGEKVIFDIDFKKILSCQNIEEIILILDETSYKKPLLTAKDRFKERNSTFYLESALDIDYYQRLILYCEKLSSYDKKISRKILGIEIDIENINSLIRLRKYYSLSMSAMMDVVIPGGEKIDKDSVRNFYTTDGLSKIVEGVALGPYAKVKELVEANIYFIENFLYEILLREIRRVLAGFPFTIGTIIGYLILKRRETKNLISLIYAKSLGEKNEDISHLIGI